MIGIVLCERVEGARETRAWSFASLCVALVDDLVDGFYCESDTIVHVVVCEKMGVQRAGGSATVCREVQNGKRIHLHCCTATRQKTLLSVSVITHRRCTCAIRVLSMTRCTLHEAESAHLIALYAHISASWPAQKTVLVGIMTFCVSSNQHKQHSAYSPKKPSLAPYHVVSGWCHIRQ